MNLQVVVNFQVIDESDDWIVVNKPAPLIVHPANNKPEPTLLGGLEALLVYEIQNGGNLGIVTRLDRETSGVVLVSKHKEAAKELGWIFERRQAKKQYLAIVNGWPKKNTWQCSEPIIRAGKLGYSEIWVKQMVHAMGRDCMTRFQVELRFEREGNLFSLIRCFPETGRMHQIRVHLAASGFPILGDKVYSENGNGYLEWLNTGWTDVLQRKLVLPRHALHSAVLEMEWGKLRRFEAEMSRDMVEFVSGKPINLTPDLVIWNRDD